MSCAYPVQALAVQEHLDSSEDADVLRVDDRQGCRDHYQITEQKDLPAVGLSICTVWYILGGPGTWLSTATPPTYVVCDATPCAATAHLTTVT